MNESESGPVRRREFLSWSIGAAGLLTPALLRADGGWRKKRGGGLGRDHKRPFIDHVAVGYLLESDTLHGLEYLTHACGGYVDEVGESIEAEQLGGLTEVVHDHLVDAHRMRSGDPGFVHTGARCTIHGFFVGDGALWQRIGPVGVYAHYEPFSSAPCLVWADDGLSTGRPVSFDMPVTKRAGMTFSLDFHDARDSEPREPTERPPFDEEGFYDTHVFVRFAPGTEWGAPKLRRGLYVIAWTPLGSRRRAALEACALAIARSDIEDAAVRKPWLSSLEGKAAAEFAYLLVSVDAAQ